MRSGEPTAAVRLPLIATSVRAASRCQMVGREESTVEPRWQGKKLDLFEANKTSQAVQLF